MEKTLSFLKKHWMWITIVVLAILFYIMVIRKRKNPIAAAITDTSSSSASNSVSISDAELNLMYSQLSADKKIVYDFFRSIISSASPSAATQFGNENYKGILLKIGKVSDSNASVLSDFITKVAKANYQQMLAMNGAQIEDFVVNKMKYPKDKYKIAEGTLESIAA